MMANQLSISMANNEGPQMVNCFLFVNEVNYGELVVYWLMMLSNG